MSYGFKCFSSSGDLLIDDTSSVLHYLGAATFIEEQGDGVATEIFSLYRITTSISPLVFLRLTGTQLGSVVAIGPGPTGTFDILVVGNPAAVLCYGKLSTEAALSSYGSRVLSASGQVLFDSTRSPLWLSEAFSVAGSSATPYNVAALPGAITLAQTYTSPAICAVAAGNHFDSWGKVGNPGTIQTDYRRFGWQRSTTGYTPVWISTAAGEYEAVTVNYRHHASGIAAHTVMVAETAGV